METGWGAPHAVVAILATLVVGVRALPFAAERIATRWSRLRGRSRPG